jgi:haloacetate dehalogenase
MSDLADLYPGFASHWIDTSAGKLFARAGGSGPPLMLVHGYAQTNAMWHDLDARLAYRIWHWTFLALPAPGPENIIGRHAVAVWNWKTAPATKAKSLAAFDPRALAHYHAFFSDPLRIHATCEDYRAGRTTDLAHDEADRAAGRKIACPMLAIWGASGIPSETKNPLDTWREWANDVRGFAIDCGHYLPEEDPQATAAALLDFFR